VALFLFKEGRFELAPPILFNSYQPKPLALYLLQDVLNIFFLPSASGVARILEWGEGGCKAKKQQLLYISK